MLMYPFNSFDNSNKIGWIALEFSFVTYAFTPFLSSFLFSAEIIID